MNQLLILLISSNISGLFFSCFVPCLCLYVGVGALFFTQRLGPKRDLACFTCRNLAGSGDDFYLQGSKGIRDLKVVQGYQMLQHDFYQGSQLVLISPFRNSFGSVVWDPFYPSTYEPVAVVAEALSEVPLSVLNPM